MYIEKLKQLLDKKNQIVLKRTTRAFEQGKTTEKPYGLIIEWGCVNYEYIKSEIRNNEICIFWKTGTPFYISEKQLEQKQVKYRYLGKHNCVQFIERR